MAGNVEAVVDDANDPDAVGEALDGSTSRTSCCTRSGPGGVRRDRAVDGANLRGPIGGRQVGRIVYLGGMVPADESLSEHLRSRAEVARILLDSAVPVAVLQAGVVIGAGDVDLLRLTKPTMQPQ